MMLKDDTFITGVYKLRLRFSSGGHCGGMFVSIQMLEPASAAVAVYVVSESPRLFRKLRGSRCTSVLRRYHEVCLWATLLCVILWATL